MVETIELLSPARNAETGCAAINAGADAVYIGAPAFGARAAAGNSIEDIARLVTYAHMFRARIYVTMNTILYPDELEAAREMVWRLYAIGVDAIIVQDMAYLEMDLPPIALHASTQCDIRTPAKAAMLARAGFSQLVLPREFNSEQIKACAQAAGIPVEIFVHGALCVSYSGDCQAGYVATGRSANRGECPQMCRLPYDLVDKQGRILMPRKHFLSLRDMKRIEHLAELIEAGASSFKIEGRLKDIRYVTNVTAAYSQALNAIVEASGGKLRRSSFGRSSCGFTPDLNRTFNRGYSDYFLSSNPGKMATLDTPKWAGVVVGKTTSPYDSRRRCITAHLSQKLSNGDGLGYFDSTGRYHGFRLNRVDGKTLYPASALENITPGIELYRNADKAFFDRIDNNQTACSRRIAVNFSLSPLDDSRIVIEANDERGCKATAVFESEYSQADTDQSEYRRRTLEKTGGTIYVAASIDDRLDNRFVPASVLTRCRREILSLLDAQAEATYTYDRRRNLQLADDEFEKLPALTYHDNVANEMAAHFYSSRGAVISQQAIERSKKISGDTVVMTTRYCLRRELGACLKTPAGQKLPSPLFLRNESGLYRLDFDCKRCGMCVVKTENDVKRQ